MPIVVTVRRAGPPDPGGDRTASVDIAAAPWPGLARWAHECVEFQPSRSHRSVPAGRQGEAGRARRRAPRPAARPAGGAGVRAGVERADLRGRRDPAVHAAPGGRRAVLAAGRDRAAALRRARLVANASEGRFLLVRLDVDTAPGIVQALQLQAVPTVLAIISGQRAPLFQGVLPRGQVQQAVDQVLKTAVANGMVGRAQPVAAACRRRRRRRRGRRSGRRPAIRRRRRGAGRAVTSPAARDEFDKLLQANPNDAEAKRWARRRPGCSPAPPRSTRSHGRSPPATRPRRPATSGWTRRTSSS